MKKKFIYIFITIIMMCIYSNVDASSLGVSCPSSVYVGDKVTCTITAYNSSLSGVDASVSYSGMKYSSASNLSGGDKVQFDSSRMILVFAPVNNSKKVASYTFTTSKTGTAKINLNCNTLSDGDFKDLSCSGTGASITIKSKTVKKPTTEEKTTSDTSSTGVKTVTKGKTSIKEETESKKLDSSKKEDSSKSSNINLKSISVEGYNVELVDGMYVLDVDSAVEKININAVAEDAKAVVLGTGEKDLVIGENKFTVTVKAEDGSIHDYELVVTRKEKEEKLIVNKDKTEDKKSFDKKIYIFIVLAVLLVIGFLFIFFRRKDNDEEEK